MLTATAAAHQIAALPAKQILHVVLATPNRLAQKATKLAAAANKTNHNHTNNKGFRLK